MSNLMRTTLLRRAEAPAAAGTSTLTTDWIDTCPGQGVLFVGSLGTLTTSASPDTIVKAQMSDYADGAGAVDIDGSTLTFDEDADDNKLWYLDVLNPRKRYVSAVIDPGSANIVHDLTVAMVYGCHDGIVQEPGQVSRGVSLINPPAAA